MRRARKSIIFLLCLGIFTALPGCDASEGADGTTADGETAQAPKDEYEEYIRSAIESVSDDKGGDQARDSANDPNTKTVTVDRTSAAGLQVSSMEDGDDYDPGEDPFATPTADPSPTVDPNATPTPTPTPYITPEDFEVDKCCIYINGENDSSYGTEIITAINKVRTDLGYKPLISNKGLSTCADRRTRESAANFSHTRPNGLLFTSVAPEHYKAEMLVIDNQKAEETVDALIKRDPISRNLIFTEKYQSIGAASFKCNGMRYTVVAFGL